MSKRVMKDLSENLTKLRNYAETLFDKLKEQGVFNGMGINFSEGKNFCFAGNNYEFRFIAKKRDADFERNGFVDGYLALYKIDADNNAVKVDPELSFYFREDHIAMLQVMLKYNNNIERSSGGWTTFSFNNQENEVLSRIFADNFWKIVNNEELYF